MEINELSRHESFSEKIETFSQYTSNLAIKFEVSRMKYKRTSVILVYSMVLLLTLIVFNLINSILPTAGDIQIYYTYSSYILNGLTPYSDFRLEYPPLALIFFIIPGWLNSLFTPPLLSRFAIFFHIECFILAVGTLAVIAVTWRKVYAKGRLITWTWQLGLYTLGALIICLYLLQRFDIASAFLTALALYLFYCEKPGWTGLVIALGSLVKLYPGLLLPLMLMYYWQRRHSLRPIVLMISSFGITCLLVILPTAILVTPKSLLSFLAYHAERGIQTESIFAGLIMLGRAAGVTTAKISDDHGSLNLASDWSRSLASFSTVLTVVGLVVIYWFIWRKLSNKNGRLDPDFIIQAASILVLWFILANKVLSPQYMIWLLPFLPFWKGSKVWLYLVALTLSFIPFPFLIVGISHLEPLPYLVLAVRNALLVVILVQLFEFLWEKRRKRTVPNTKNTVQAYRS